MPDAGPSFNKTASDALANSVAQFWKDRGYAVDVETVESKTYNGKTVYSLRSNLTNGLPANYRRPR